MNDLYKAIGQSNGGFSPDMLKRFTEFKRTFSGDPKAQVQALLDSGKMNQSQYNQLSAMASQLMQILK